MTDTLGEMPCPRCGRLAEAGSRYCNWCGAAMEAEERLGPGTVVNNLPEMSDSPALKARFVEEARLMLLLQHPGIVRCRAFWGPDHAQPYGWRCVEEL